MNKKYFQEILSYSFKTKNKVIPEHLVKPLLKEEGINVPRYVLIDKLSDLEKTSRLHFPVALKVSSSKFIHKTDVGGVVLNIKDRSELKKSVIVFKKKFKEEKLIVEEMVNGNVEMISGLVYDSNFGMCIMIGVGGIYTEIYKDTSTRVVPVSKDDILQMIEGIQRINCLYYYMSWDT
ncbi:MAG: acetate--CoA ligase family protein [Thermoproteota archaeon]